MAIDPIFRFHPEDFDVDKVRRKAILREYNIYKPIMHHSLSPLELTKMEILINEMFQLSNFTLNHFVLKESGFAFWLYLTRVSYHR